jgi:tetratricopeptide (TPR) repeat protein
MTISHLHKSLGVCAVLGTSVLLSASPLYASSPIEQQLNIRHQTFYQSRSQQDAEQLVDLGEQRMAEGRYEAGIAAWQEAIALYSALGDTQAVEEISASLARQLVQLQRYDEAANAFRQGLTIAAENGDIANQIRGLNNLGMVYIQQGQITPAQTVFVEALRLADDSHDLAGMGSALSNLGLAARQLGDLESARHYYEAATDYRLKAGDDLGLAHSSNSLGMIYHLLGEDRKAIGAYRVARYTALELDHIPTLLTALDGLIEIYSDRGDTTQLSSYINERLAMTQTDASPAQKLGLFIGLGRYYELMEEPSQAQAAYRQALDMAEQVGDSRQQTYILNRLQALGMT